MADKRIGELPLIEDLDDESFFVAEQQGAAGHITGAQIKGFARKSVEDIANASQKSAEAAAKSASAAQESATQAEEAQEAAESAKSGAEVAQKAAETAQGAAADAQAGAESAKTAAEAAADVAAKDAAEGVREELSVYVEQTEANAQAAADSASEAAASQEAAAQSAQGAAGSATAAAQDAVDAADARTAAEAAQGKAEAAQGAAEAAKSGAETAAGTATTKAEEASASAETAKQYSGKPPKPQNGTWWVWNAETQAYTDTGIKSVLSIVKSYPSVEAMEADKLNMHEGDLVIIASTVDDPDNSKLYVHDGVGWVYLSDLSGVEGVGIAGISQTDGNHAPGTTDTYTIELTDGSSYEFTVYNGADGDGSGDMQSSTYDPQGKAQDIFGYADNAAKGKQDKLKGTAGQVVGFDSEGNAIPQAAPSGLPDGGTVGQLLEKTEDGAEWADKPVMYVNITPPAGDSPFGTADHTIAEITQAVLNGVTVLSKISAGTDTKVIPLSTVTDSVASFSSTSVDYGGSVIANIVPQEQSEVVIIAEDQFRASQILYDKGTSGLDSDDVQGAIKELAKNKQDSADAVTVSGGGTMQMGESLGDGPYTIEVTEDGEGGDLSAEQVGYNNEGTGLTATNVQDAVTELFTSVSEGKAAIAAAITDKGVETAADATFQQMAGNIEQISAGGGWAVIKAFGNSRQTRAGGGISEYGNVSIPVKKEPTALCILTQPYSDERSIYGTILAKDNGTWEVVSKVAIGAPDGSFIVDNITFSQNTISFRVGRDSDLFTFGNYIYVYTIYDEIPLT